MTTYFDGNLVTKRNASLIRRGLDPVGLAGELAPDDFVAAMFPLIVERDKALPYDREWDRRTDEADEGEGPLYEAMAGYYGEGLSVAEAVDRLYAEHRGV